MEEQERKEENARKRIEEIKSKECALNFKSEKSSLRNFSSHKREMSENIYTGNYFK